MAKKEKKPIVRQIYVDDDKGVLRRRTAMAGGFILGHIDEKGFIFEMVGEPNFNQTVDDFCSGLYHMMSLANEVTDGKAKDEIYTRVNQAVSLVLDEFYPEMKDKKFLLSDEEILKLEDAKINKEYDRIKQEKT